MLDPARIASRSEVAETITKTASEESNHRIANNLALVGSLVRMKANAVLKRAEALQPDEAAAMLKEIAQRIEGVAKLHRMLSHSASQDHIVAGPFLEEVCNGVAGSFAIHHAVGFRDDSEAVELLPERLNALGLFLAEGLTNAFKHSHPAGAPGRIQVVFAKTDRNGMRLAIQDDGVGLPENFDPKTDGGLGMRIMRSLSDQLGGQISIKGGPLGLYVGVDAPAWHKKASVHAV